MCAYVYLCVCMRACMCVWLLRTFLGSLSPRSFGRVTNVTAITNAIVKCINAFIRLTLALFYRCCAAAVFLPAYVYMFRRFIICTSCWKMRNFYCCTRNTNSPVVLQVYAHTHTQAHANLVCTYSNNVSIYTCTFRFVYVWVCIYNDHKISTYIYAYALI